MTTAPRFARIDVAGTRVDVLRRADVERAISDAVDADGKLSVFYANAHAVNLSASDPSFRALLDRADIVFCDGHGVRLASRVLGSPLPERFTPPDWIASLASRCAAAGHRVFLLGGAPGVASRAARVLEATTPGLTTSSHHGFFDPRGPENDEVVRAIDASGARVLLVGMGMPRQEHWIHDNLARLRTVNVAMAVGAMFDTLSGDVQRGHPWMTDHGLEWATRLVAEPRRLWRRYLVGNPLFVARVVRARLAARR